MTSDHGAGHSGPGFDAVLRRHRQRANLTQEELAARAAIGVRTVRDLERGRSSRPQRTTVELLATALGLHGRDRAGFLAAARGRATGEPPSRVAALPPAGDLVGRDADVAELVTRLTSPVPPGPRGVTVVGLAGVGKTALALVVAHRLAASYRDGVAGIVVTDGFTPGEVLGSVAGVFGVGRPDDLPARFAGTPALLLVDAVERAPESVASALSMLLADMPTLRFLATGRHPVGLPAERVWPLAPLLSPPSGATSRSEVSAYPAVGLFLDRLSRVRRGPVEDDEMPALVTLVRRLGGLPLAIELAAARGRVLTVPEILDRYGDRVLDLAGRPGDGVVTMRDAVAASYRLLDPPEQAALRRLAMFRHRWSLTLAEQMIDDGSDVVHLLDRLLELGLLSIRGSRPLRFRLLDVVRDYAVERAAEAGELTDARRRHAVVFADLAVRTAPDLVGALGEAGDRFDEVVGDLGAALSFAAGEDPHTALRLAAALPRWWRFRGRDVAGRQWLRRLLDDPRTADADPEVRAWAKVGLAQLAREHGAGAEELPSAESALADFERLGSVAGQLTALTQLVALALVTGRYDDSRRYAEAGLALARENGRIRDLAVAENNLTWHEIRQGDLAAARRRLSVVERLAARSGEDRLRALAVANQAEVARLDGHPDEAVRLGRRVVTELEGIGDPNHRRRVLATIGLALAEMGRVTEAERIHAQLRPGAAATFPDDGPQAVVEGAIAAHRGEGKRAAECFARAADAYEGTSDPRDLVTALIGLIISAPDTDRRDEAIQRLSRLCADSGLTLLPRERDLLGAEATRAVVDR